MSLSSIQLDAFLAVARERSFSRAAVKLHITQSALSQRVLNLEKSLGATLFIREPMAVRLTELGVKFLRFCQTKESLELEFIADIQSGKEDQLVGVLRVMGFSTITKSILLPVIGGFARKNPAVQLEIKSYQLRELPQQLESGQADFIFITHPLEKQGIENVLLGYEENVLIQSSINKVAEHVYLDHDEDDVTTQAFFNIQSKSPRKWQRNYLGEIYLIVEGVIEGMGRATIPLHIAENLKGIEVVSGYKPLKTPVYLAYYNQKFYTRLHQAIVKLLKEKVPAYLTK